MLAKCARRVRIADGATVADLLSGATVGPVLVPTWEPRRGFRAAYRADGSALVWLSDASAVTWADAA